MRSKRQIRQSDKFAKAQDSPKFAKSSNSQRNVCFHVFSSGQVHDYGNGVSISHGGALNAEAVLNWTKSQFSHHPEEIIVKGGSAGGWIG